MPDRPLPPMSPYPLPTSAGADDKKVPQGNEVFYFVIDCMDNAATRQGICDRLMEFGYSADDAALIVADVAERRRYFLQEQEAKRLAPKPNNPGKRNMLIGACLLLSGGLLAFGNLLAIGGIFLGASLLIYGYVQYREE